MWTHQEVYDDRGKLIMNLNQLLYVSEISRLGSFSKAAQTLYISQSALSKSIHALEMELKQEIFIRTPEGVTTTEFGKTFILESEKIMQHVSRIKGMTVPEENKEILKFSVVCGQMFFAKEVFLRMMSRYLNTNTEFEFYQKSQSAVFEAVRDKVCNLGIVAALTTYSEEVSRLFIQHDMEYHSLGRMSVGVAVGRNNPIYESGVTRLKKSMLKGQILVAMKEEIWPFSREQEEIRAAFGNPKTVYVSDNDTAVSICNQMPAFFCVAQSERLYNKLNMPLGMLLYPYQNMNLKYEYGWIKRRNTELTSVEKLFISEITSLFKK